MTNEPFKRFEAATLIWEEMKYRHDLFWSVLSRWGLAAVTVSIVPWVNPGLINTLHTTVLIFPVLAFIIALFASWHIGSEYLRLVAWTIKYKEIMGDLYPNSNSIMKWKLINFLFTRPIGWIVTVGFLIIAIPLSLVNAILLLGQMQTFK